VRERFSALERTAQQPYASSPLQEVPTRAAVSTVCAPGFPCWIKDGSERLVSRAREPISLHGWFDAACRIEQIRPRVLLRLRSLQALPVSAFGPRPIVSALDAFKAPLHTSGIRPIAGTRKPRPGERCGASRWCGGCRTTHYRESVVDPEPVVVSDGARAASLSAVFGRPNVTIAITTANTTKPTAHGIMGLVRSF
jgi:hypothetical protein